jgi:hypothetical protein
VCSGRRPGRARRVNSAGGRCTGPGGRPTARADTTSAPSRPVRAVLARSDGSLLETRGVSDIRCPSSSLRVAALSQERGCCPPPMGGVCPRARRGAAPAHKARAPQRHAGRGESRASGSHAAGGHSAPGPYVLREGGRGRGGRARRAQARLRGVGGPPRRRLCGPLGARRAPRRGVRDDSGRGAAIPPPLRPSLLRVRAGRRSPPL